MEENKKNWEPVDFTIYIKFVSWLVLITLAVEFLLRWFLEQFAAGTLYENKELIAWLWRLIIFTITGWRVVKSFGYGEMIGGIAGVFSGVAVGFGIALMRFASGFEIWKIFNLITETITVALVGCLSVILYIYIASFFSKFFNK